MRIALKSAAAVVLLGVAVWAVRSETARGAGEGAGDAGAPSTPAAAPGLPAGFGDPGWRLDPLWDDGKAELCAYRVRWPRYGAPRQGSALLVLVKEPWAPDLDVKADTPRADGFEVLKLNHVRDVRTGIYAYHQMASVFLDRRSGSLVKLATTSSEACGITTAEMTDGRLATRSYFDGQGDRSVPWPGGLPEDGLPALLRDLVRGDLPPALWVFPSTLAGKLPPLAPVERRLRRRRLEAVPTPTGERPGVALELSAAAGGTADRYVFDAAAPHPLLALDKADGTRYRLARCERLAYWQLNRPGDEEWLPADLR